MVGPDQAELEAAGWCIEKSAGWWTCYPPSGSMFEFLNVPTLRVLKALIASGVVFPLPPEENENGQ